MSGVKTGIMLSAQSFEGADMVRALEEQIEMVRLARDRGWDSYFCGQHYLNEGGNQGLQMVPYIEELGVTHFVFRTHLLGMPVSIALASMRFMSEGLLPALHAAKPTPLEKMV
jgi:hypothetical protein